MKLTQSNLNAIIEILKDVENMSFADMKDFLEVLETCEMPICFREELREFIEKHRPVQKYGKSQRFLSWGETQQ